MQNYPNKLFIYTEKNFLSIPQISLLNEEQVEAIRIVSRVLPFRVNSYVLDHLINWSNIPDDPIFQLTFPQKKMLTAEHFQRVNEALSKNDNELLKRAIYHIRLGLNPHPADQMTKNIPRIEGRQLKGFQHKYDETLLFFPASGQTCHTYCTFCFRWAQFIGEKEFKFISHDLLGLKNYLKRNPQITDILITGGDPLIARTDKIKAYIDEILKIESIRNIRIGTKALTYWPQRFTIDDDADDLLRLFEKIVESKKHLAIMAHYNHPNELQTKIAQDAVRRIGKTGSIIRSQGPILAHINDSANIWADLWKCQVSLGIIPYYMFVERDTGAQDYFKVSLTSALKIYKEAYNQVTGLARTVRGPSMSTSPGKVMILDTLEINNKKYFVMEFIQARNKQNVGKLFFVDYDENAVWYDHLDIYLTRQIQSESIFMLS